MVTLRADPWSPDYGGDVEATLAAGEGTEIQVDPTIETTDWSQAIVPGGVPSGPLLFVDGVRRVDLRVLAEDGGRRAWGLAGSYAVGAVRSDGRATFEPAVVGRILAIGAAIASPDLEVRVGRTTPIVVPGDRGPRRRSRGATPGPPERDARGGGPAGRRARPDGARPRRRPAPLPARAGCGRGRDRQADGHDLPGRRAGGAPAAPDRPASGRRCSRSAARSSTGSPGTSA